MKELIIVGAGGLGRELFSYIESDNPIFNFKGFLDDRSNILDNTPRNPGIIGSPDTYIPGPNQVYLAAIGNSQARFRYTKHLRNLDVDFGQVIHPAAHVSHMAKLGRGTIIGPRVGVSVDVNIGEFTFIQEYTVIGHDAVIGDWCQINSHCTLSGNCNIGNYVQIGPNCVVTSGAIIEDNVTIAPGSVVYGRIKSGLTVLGNPARRFNF
jgi:sugar O-acyltransferase (sialic acid O-acetyltransferase NeuD family)